LKTLIVYQPGDLAGLSAEEVAEMKALGIPREQFEKLRRACACGHLRAALIHLAHAAQVFPSVHKLVRWLAQFIPSYGETWQEGKEVA